MGRRYKSQSRDPCTGKGPREGHEWAAIDPLPVTVLDNCLRRISRWRVPPNWSISDWRSEMRAEAAYAAWLAVCDYNPSLGVPFSAFVHQRVLATTLTHYRREWAYALRSAHEYDLAGSASRPLDSTTSDVFDDWPGHAPVRLSKLDLWLMEQLFLRDRTEANIATQIGITQQAVNKRKWMLLLRLRRYIAETSSEQRGVFSPLSKVGTHLKLCQTAKKTIQL